MPLYTQEDIKKFIPHREPFLFLDSVDSIIYPENYKIELNNEVLNAKHFIGTEVSGSFHVSDSLEILKGHFPGHPILPGVIQIEIMAQMCPFIFFNADKELMENYKADVALLGIDKARFKKPVLPGANLKMEATFIKERGVFQTYDCQIKENGMLVSKAEIFASIKFIERKNHE